MPRATARTARTTEPPRKSGSRWTWVAVWLLLAGVLGLWGLGGSHTGSATPVNPAAVQHTTIPSAEPALRTKPIEQVQLGERLSGRNPLREEVDLGEPDPVTWRRVELRLSSPGGNRAEIEFLWPPEYLEATGATVGGWVELDMPEVGAVGQAEVLAIGPCPAIPPGAGPIVTGRFVHQSDGPVVNVYVEGMEEPIGGTSNHPFWSEDRQQFIPAGDLRPGERVRTQASGILPVTHIAPRPTTAWVYNLQVHGEHVYQVSELGVLVHNTCGPKNRTKWGPEHGKGNVAHNNATEDVLDAAKARGATDIRKNRVQRDVAGNRVYASDGSYTRPDGSWVEDGVRHNFSRVSNSNDIDREIDAFMKMIGADPDAIHSLEF